MVEKTAKTKKSKGKVVSGKQNLKEKVVSGKQNLKVVLDKPNLKEKEIGYVSNYFQHVKAAAIKLSAPLKKGDKIKIVGGERAVEMTVDSMQIERKPIEKAKKGDEIGLLVPEDVHKGNKVYKI